MSLRDRYNAHGKGNAKQWLIIAAACFFVGIIFLIYPAFSRYFDNIDGRLSSGIAQWTINVNGVDVAFNSASDNVGVKFIPVPDPNDPDTALVPDFPEKIKAGQKGYFDVVINPNGTEVSFSYSVVINMQNSFLPNGMEVSSYSLNGGEAVALSQDSPSVSGIMNLPASGIFTEANLLTVRFFWAWAADADYDQLKDYNIVINTSFTQYYGESEGASTL